MLAPVDKERATGATNAPRRDRVALTACWAGLSQGCGSPGLLATDISGGPEPGPRGVRVLSRASAPRALRSESAPGSHRAMDVVHVSR